MSHKWDMQLKQHTTPCGCVNSLFTGGFEEGILLGTLLSGPDLVAPQRALLILFGVRPPFLHPRSEPHGHVPIPHSAMPDVHWKFTFNFKTVTTLSYGGRPRYKSAGEPRLRSVAPTAALL
jgi:hypothetical protein